MAFATQFRRVLSAAFVFFLLAAGITAFATGFTVALIDSLANPSSAQTLRLSALGRLDDALGYNGFLKIYPDFVLETGNAAQMELGRFADESEAGLVAFLNASLRDNDRKEASVLRELSAPFRRVVMFKAGGGDTLLTGLPPVAELGRAYASLKSEIAKAAEAANRDRLEQLSGPFLIAEGALIAAVWLLAGILFAYACFLHRHLIVPVNRLRSSINAAAAGAMAETVWGIKRKDEIGGVARAGERLRQAAVTASKAGSAEADEWLAKSAGRLDAELINISTAVAESQARIEAASARATAASQAAAEAAELARDGSVRFAERAEQTLAFSAEQTNAVLNAVMNAATRLSAAAERLDEAQAIAAAHAAPVAAGSEPLPVPLLRQVLLESGELPPRPDAVIEDLVGDLEALERFASERKDIPGDKAVAMTASLAEAIGRLNAIAERISASADHAPLRAAS